MVIPASDVSIAADLIKQVDLQRWLGIGHDLLLPTPLLRRVDADHLDATFAWIAATARTPRSYVDAAVANASRVLADLLLVLHYDMEWHGLEHYRVTQWYRRAYPDAGPLEEFGVHVALIHNLTLELNRAWNLVIDRVRQVAADMLSGSGNAVLPAGPMHAPTRAVSYSEAEASDPEPYPGLVAFPTAVRDRRDEGSLGETTSCEPRDIAAFADWIDHLTQERAAPSGPPRSAKDLPFALARPENTPPSEGLPGGAKAVIALVASASAVAGLLAYPWLLGATAGAGLMVGLLHRRVWRVPPETFPALVVLLAAVLGAGVAEWLSSLSGSDRAALPEGQNGRSSDSPAIRAAGQIEFGNIFRGRTPVGETFEDPITILPEAIVALRFRVSNPGPDAITGTRLKARLPSIADRSVSVIATASADNANPRETSDTVTLVVAETDSVCLRYVVRSTRLIDAKGGVLRALSDDVARAGVDLGSVGVGPSETRFVEFDVRAVPTAEGRACA